MELQAGRPQAKGNSRGPAYAYNVKKLRNQEMRVAEQAQKSYEHFVEAWRPRPVKGKGARAPQSGNRLATLSADAPRFAARSPTRAQ